jgi:hypothetical protein
MFRRLTSGLVILALSLGCASKNPSREMIERECEITTSFIYQNGAHLNGMDYQNAKELCASDLKTFNFLNCVYGITQGKQLYTEDIAKCGGLHLTPK